MTAPLGNIGDLSQLIQPIFDAAAAHSGVLVGAGKTFLGVAFVLELFGLVLNFWVKGGASEMIAKGARLLIVTSIPFAVLATWPSLPNTLINFFENGVSSAFTGVQGDGLSSVSTAMTQVNDACAKLLDFSQQAPPAHWWDKITAAIVSVAVYIILFIPVLLLSLAMLFSLYGPLLMLYLGIIFGPILVAWLPWEPMSNLATKWLNYMITMGLAFAIGIALASMMTGALTQFAATVQAQNTGADIAIASLAGLIPMIGCIAFIGYMMLKVEHIAAAMVGGPSIGGGAGFFGMAAGMAMRGGGGKSKGGDKQPKQAAGGGGQGGDPGAAPGGGQGPGGGGSTAANLSQGASQSAGQPAPQANPSTTASSAPGASTSPGSPSSGFGQKMASAAKAVAGSGAGKLAAFGGAAVAGGPIAAAAVGAYAVSPTLRKGVNAAAKGAGRAVAAGGAAAASGARAAGGAAASGARAAKGKLDALRTSKSSGGSSPSPSPAPFRTPPSGGSNAARRPGSVPTPERTYGPSVPPSTP